MKTSLVPSHIGAQIGDKIEINQKEKVERLAQFGPTREISNKNLSLNRKKIINKIWKKA